MIRVPAVLALGLAAALLGAPASAACPPLSDVDNDGYADPGDPGCDNGPDTDCDDSDPTVFPGAVEICDGLDQNCDGLVDNAGSIQLTVNAAGLSWTPVLGASAYDVLSGNLVTLKSSQGDFTAAASSCAIDATAATTLAAPYVTGSGQLFFLVRSDTWVCAAAWGTYDSLATSQRGSRDMEAMSSGVDCLAP